MVYTCVTGRYDELIRPLQVEPGVRYVLLTDQAGATGTQWQSREFKPAGMAGAEANRFAKMHPHLLFPDCSTSIYLDGNIAILGGLGALASAALADHDIALYRHPFRDCAYEEALECAAVGHGWYWRIRRQMDGYRSAGFPVHAGLFECNVIVRRHTSASVRALMGAWWQAYRRGLKRDQVSLPYLSWKMGIPIKDLGESDQRIHMQHFAISIGHSNPLPRLTEFRGWVNRKVFLP